MKKLSILAVASAIVLGGCMHTADQKTVIKGKTSSTKLSFFNGATALAEKNRYRFATIVEEDAAGTKASVSLSPVDASFASTIGSNTAHDDAIFNKACGVPPQSGFLAEGMVAAAAAKLLEKGINFAIDKIDSALQKEMEKYTGTYGGSTSFAFYGTGTQLAQNCFRLTRLVKASKDSAQPDTVAFDLVGQMRLQNETAIQIRPLRLYYAKPKAKSKEEEKDGTAFQNYGLTVSLEMDAIWRKGNEGKTTAGAIKGDLLALKVKKESGAYYKAFNFNSAGTEVDETEAAWAAYRANPILPVSTGGGANQSTYANVKMTVAEVGNAPKVLAKIADLFSDNKDTIKQQLNEAAAKLLPGEEEATE